MNKIKTKWRTKPEKNKKTRHYVMQWMKNQYASGLLEGLKKSKVSIDN